MSDRYNFDFDNTLTESSVKWWTSETADPDTEMCQLVRDVYASGGFVIIWTARPWSQAKNIAARLTEWRVPYHGIRCEKGSADFYIDDKMTDPETITPQNKGAW